MNNLNRSRKLAARPRAGCFLAVFLLAGLLAIRATQAAGLAATNTPGAIPWSEMPEVKQRIDAGQTIKFSFRINNGGSAFELAAGRSVSKDNCFAFHNDWSTHWSNELEFGIEK